MKTSEIAEPVFGDKLYQRRARKALPILIRQARAESPITYGNLAQELDMPNPRNLDRILGSIGQTIENLNSTTRWRRNKIPPIQALVCNKTTGLPGEGIEGFIKKGYGSMQRRKKQRIIDNELSMIYNFQDWDEVLKDKALKHLNLKSPKTGYSGYSTTAAKNMRARYYGRAGGESDEHKALKSFVYRNPKIIGIKDKIQDREKEYLLLSGDKVDVQFVTRKEEIAVEVKSKISDMEDCRRGLYQCVKYLAVIEAQQRADNRHKDPRAILVLESKLPKELILLRNILGVEVVDEVRGRKK